MVTSREQDRSNKVRANGTERGHGRRAPGLGHPAGIIWRVTLRANYAMQTPYARCTNTSLKRTLQLTHAPFNPLARHGLGLGLVLMIVSAQGAAHAPERILKELERLLVLFCFLPWLAPFTVLLS